VGEQRGYYLDREHVATSVHAPNAFVAWANEAASPAQLAARVREAGFTKLIFVPRELRRLGEGIGTFTPAGAANWSGLEPDHLKPALKTIGCAVYDVQRP
jgi:hypothetical protein